MSLHQPAFSDREIARGRWDRYIRKFAEQARRWGYPFFLRFDWEMNGNWFPWGIGVNGNRISDFVDAWRHVHHIFEQVGANNASWLWCPNIGRWASLYRLWPGASYVDWTCLDGYNWGTLRGKFVQFRDLFSAPYATIAHHIAPEKPMMLGEVASNDHGGSEAAWIARMFRELPTQFPDIRGFLWFQARSQWDFILHPGTPAARSFAAGLRSARYAPNYFCRVAGVSLTQLDAVRPTPCKH
jgi:beta-mannanase